MNANRHALVFLRGNMSRKSELSAKVFAVYLFFIGVVFVVAPNMLLAIFRIPQTSEVWIHVVGVLVFNIGVYAWVSAKHEAFLVASIYTRFLVFAVFATFAVIGLSSPMLALFGVVDLLGGIWTHFALKAEASARLSLTTHTNVTESAADLTTVSDLARRSTHTRDLLPEL